MVGVQNKLGAHCMHLGPYSQLSLYIRICCLSCSFISSVNATTLTVPNPCGENIWITFAMIITHDTVISQLKRFLLSKSVYGVGRRWRVPRKKLALVWGTIVWVDRCHRGIWRLAIPVREEKQFFMFWLPSPPRTKGERLAPYASRRWYESVLHNHW